MSYEIEGRAPNRLFVYTTSIGCSTFDIETRGLRSEGVLQKIQAAGHLGRPLSIASSGSINTGPSLVGPYPASRPGSAMMLFRLGPKIAIPGLTGATLLAAALVLMPVSAVAQYKLQSGDTLEISMAGAPDFKQRSPIGVEGTINLPLARQIKVSGLSVIEARAAVARDLSDKVYRQLTADGREIPHLVLADEIVVTVVEYRPIYVSGGVVKPGEYTFRPGITVRQAIAIAGGNDLARLQGLGPYPAVDKAFLQEAIRKIDVQLNILAEKKKKDEEGNHADTADYEKVRDLSQKGLTLATRLSDARRSALLSSDQLLQTIVEMSNVERQRGEYARQLKKVELGLAESGRPNITVYRKGEDGPQHLGADEDVELAPGDVVDVALPTGSVAEVQPRQTAR
jgi:polysaccharide export outer membrane protein